MRKAFLETLTELAKKDDRVLLVVGDVGFSYMEDFKKKFPKQFFNFGITEQSIIVIAAGLALAGFKPYVYSIINFVAFRPYEQVRNAICYHRANVKLIGAGGADNYKFKRYSHNIERDEDIKVLTGLPNLAVYIPTTPDAVASTILSTHQNTCAAYIRI